MPSNPADYQRSYRESNQDYVERSKKLEAARRAARIRLAELHPRQYNKILEEEKERRNIT